MNQFNVFKADELEKALLLPIQTCLMILTAVLRIRRGKFRPIVLEGNSRDTKIPLISLVNEHEPCINPIAAILTLPRNAAQYCAAAAIQKPYSFTKSLTIL